jgi:hypothetical protein
MSYFFYDKKSVSGEFAMSHQADDADKAALAGALASKPPQTGAPDDVTPEEMAAAWATAGRTIPGALMALRIQERQPGSAAEEDLPQTACGAAVSRGPPMVFTIRRHSDLNVEEQREIATVEELMGLMTEFKFHLALCPRALFSKHPVIWVCDSHSE